MEQLVLLPHPRVEYCRISNDQRRTLENIALLASDHELLFGEPTRRKPRERSSYILNEGVQYLPATPEDRLDKIVKYLPETNSYVYSIQFEGNIIGFVSIDDGWMPHDMDYTTPEVKVAFIHPDFKGYEPQIRNQITGILRRIEENPE